MGRPRIIEREALLQAAREVFTRKGFEAATLADIADILKVSPAGILRHIGSKQALYVEAMGEQQIVLPDALTELRKADPADPLPPLRRMAEAMIPFLRQRLRQLIGLYMHMKADPDFFALPPAIRIRTSGPARALEIVEDFLARARKAGTLRLDSPRAAALLFLGALQSYAFFHFVVEVTPRPFPLQRYLDTLFDLWTRGGIRRGKRNAS